MRDRDPIEVLRRIGRTARRMEQDASLLYDDMTLLFEILGPGAAQTLEAILMPFRKKEIIEQAAERLAAAQLVGIGVNDVSIERRPEYKDWARVMIDIMGKPKDFLLPCALADLLELLKGDWGESTDEKVGWKEAAVLAKRLNVSVTAVTTAISRLRKAMKAQDVNRWLVETKKHPLRYRFARRRKKTVVIESNPS